MAKKITTKKPLGKGPRGPVLKTMTLAELTTYLGGDLKVEVQVSRKSLLKFTASKAKQSL